MEEVTHLWNVNQFLSQLKCPQLKKLQAFYMQYCRSLSNEVELPKQCFGPQVMCSHCGSLWTNVDHKVRIIRAKNPTGSLKKAVNSVDKSDKRIPRVRATLIKKCLKNQMNKIQITCSLCNLKTEISAAKPKKIKRTNDGNENLLGSHKKKKKRRDKTAGLNISGNISSPSIPTQSETPTVSNIKKSKTIQHTTQVPKLKKLRIDKLKEIVNQGSSPAGRRSLHSFLSQLS